VLLLACLVAAIAPNGSAHAEPDADPRPRESPDSLDGPEEPSGLLVGIDERRDQRDSLFPVAPLGWLRDVTGEAKQDLYDATHLQVGAIFTHVFQGISHSIGNEDEYGTATTLELLGALDLIHRDQPTLGQIVAHGQGRWDYDTTGPEELGTNSLGSIIGTADTFASYTPTFLLRNLYWRQGSMEAGWVYRIGKITPDALLNSSAHLDSQPTFLTSGGTGPFAIALPDSGLGAVGAWYVSDRLAVAGLVSDANADRFGWGDIDEGDLFMAAELQFKIAPRTPKAGFSKLTLWHTDGTKNGKAINGQNGPDGWGFYLKLEQELTADGRAIGILRYGRSFEKAAVYDQQVGVHFLLYEPRLLTRLKNDVVGFAFNWAEAPISTARSEYNLEAFYRFPVVPNVDMTFSYQSVFHPALTREFDHASVFSLRLRTVF
jgi:hypothetical protein